MSLKRLRYRDLVALGIIRNRPTLQNWIRDRGFPPGQLTGPNSRTWSEHEIHAWLDSRPTGPKPAPAVTRPRGRPRKAAAAEATAS
jgi:predicted DNA-binding transcriptional regulator AlpA